MRFLSIILLMLVAVTAKDVDITPFKKLKPFSDGRLILERVYEHKSIYQIRFLANTPEGRRPFEGFLTKDKKILIMGEAVNIETQSALKMPLQMEAIRKNADIVYGKGKTELIVITDPECYYCQAFQQRWPQLQEKYTFYTFLYPLSHHHEAAKMSYYVLSQKSHKLKAEALIKIAKEAHSDKKNPQASAERKKDYEKTTFSSKEIAGFDKKLAENLSFGESLGVRGTPAVYDVNGEFVIWNKLLP